MRRAEQALPLRHAVLLGVVQGPTELLPVSSSAHTALIPWLAGWPYTGLHPDQRKSFEVALHAGAGCALAIAMRRQLWRRAPGMEGRRAAVLALSLLPPAIAGAALEGPVERRLGGPLSTAVGLAGGAVAMCLADARAPAASRGLDDARAVDGVALGFAQAIALAPGVSRNGATLTAARGRATCARAWRPADSPRSPRRSPVPGCCPAKTARRDLCCPTRSIAGCSPGSLCAGCGAHNRGR